MTSNDEREGRDFADRWLARMRSQHPVTAQDMAECAEHADTETGTAEDEGDRANVLYWQGARARFAELFTELSNDDRKDRT